MLANEQYTRMNTAFRKVWPNWNGAVILVSGETGVGKSTFAAATPVEAGRKRVVFDHENGMRYLDLGDRPDRVKPTMGFQMIRMEDPDPKEWVTWFNRFRLPDRQGATIVIDQIVELQDSLANFLQSSKVSDIQKFWGQLGIRYKLPAPGLISKFSSGHGAMWVALNGFWKELTKTCQEQGHLLVITAEMHEIWKDFGKAGQESLGRKGHFPKAIVRLADLNLMLTRGRSGPPMAQIPENDPKNRLQLPATEFKGEWEYFIRMVEKWAEGVEDYESATEKGEGGTVDGSGDDGGSGVAADARQDGAPDEKELSPAETSATAAGESVDTVDQEDAGGGS